MDFKEISIPISELHLDSDNPRLSKKGMSEKGIMRELFDKEEVVGLIKSICRRSYLPNERLFVVKENGKYIVVEGNRRLCALKLLKQPSLIPELKGKVKGVINAMKNPQIEEIEKGIPVAVMNREDVRGILLLRHTSNPVRRWGLLNQMRYYRQLIDDGESVDSVVYSSGKNRLVVENFLKLEQLHRLAEKMPLDDKTLAVVENSKKFSLSTLERIAQTQKFDEFLGVKLIEGGLIEIGIAKDEFIKGYQKIVSDIANKRITTRTLNTAEDIQDYFHDFKPSEKPDIKKKGRFTVDNFTSTGAFKSTSKPRKKHVRQYMIPDDVEFALKNELLEDHFNEFQKMPIRSCPISAVISFRCFLEKSIHQYLLDKEFTDELSALEEKKGIGLKSLIVWMSNHRECGISKHAVDAAERFVNKEKYEFFSLHTFNTLVHSPHSGISPADAKEIGKHFEALVREIVKGVK